MENGERLISVKDVAHILGISQSLAYQLMRTKIPVVRFGRTVRVRREDLDLFILDNLKVGGAEISVWRNNNGTK